MDVQIVDQDNKHRSTFQHNELWMILEYAEKWSQISNNTNQNKLVIENVISIRKTINKWMRIYYRPQNEDDKMPEDASKKE